MGCAIYSLPQSNQNILLSQQIQNVRAKTKCFRISYPEPKRSTSTSTHYVKVPKTYRFSTTSRMCALSWRVLESHRYSQCSGHLHLLITDEQRQNMLLSQQIETGRAKMKSFRISYAEPKQWSANAYTTSLQRTVSHITRHPMTRYACPNSTTCNVQLMITLTAKQNTLLHREIESGRAILKS